MTNDTDRTINLFDLRWSVKKTVFLRILSANFCQKQLVVNGNGTLPASSCEKTVFLKTTSVPFVILKFCSTKKLFKYLNYTSILKPTMFIF